MTPAALDTTGDPRERNMASSPSPPLHPRGLSEQKRRYLPRTFINLATKTRSPATRRTAAAAAAAAAPPAAHYCFIGVVGGRMCCVLRHTPVRWENKYVVGDRSG